MSEISQLQINGTTYNLVDASAQNSLSVKEIIPTTLTTTGDDCLYSNTSIRVYRTGSVVQVKGRLNLAAAGTIGSWIILATGLPKNTPGETVLCTDAIPDTSTNGQKSFFYVSVDQEGQLRILKLTSWAAASTPYFGYMYITID